MLCKGNELHTDVQGKYNKSLPKRFATATFDRDISKKQQAMAASRQSLAEAKVYSRICASEFTNSKMKVHEFRGAYSVKPFIKD